MKFLLSFAFLLLTIKSRRYVEYLLPFTLLFTACSFTDLRSVISWKKIKNPAKQLIPKSKFKAIAINFEEFKKKAAQKNSIVIDARDFVQKSGDLPGLKNVRKIPFDKLIPNIVSKKKLHDKQLLIFDQVGKEHSAFGGL